ncbi:MAG: 30S ribosomal protein S3ae, partial [Methanobacteriota archaeon]
MPKTTRKRKGRLKDPWKEKEWYTVVASPPFDDVDLGETPANNPESLIGRVMETTLKDVTNDFSKQHVKLYFQIYDVKGGIAYSQFKGHDLATDYMRSRIRRGTSRVDNITTVQTKDGYRIQVQSVVITSKRAKTSQIDAIREIMGKIVSQTAENSDFNEFIREHVLGGLASEIQREAKKITRIRRVEIKKTKVLSRPKTEVPTQVETPGKEQKAEPVEAG